MELSAFEKRVMARAFKPDSKLGRVASAIFALWFMSSLFIASHIVGSYLLLVWFYGFSRVHKEGLHITNSPSPQRAENLEVSNDDHISYADSFIGLPITVFVWLALVLVGYLIIKQISRWRKEAVYKKILEKIYDA
jgi:hypothetical protein